jgi:F-type H+/Na+-transporting ATPase subunit beta
VCPDASVPCSSGATLASDDWISNTTMTATAADVVGRVIQVAGPAVDIQFPEGQIPVINTAVRITSEGFDVPEPIDIIVEIAQHIGESRARAIALQPTDGLVRGMNALSLGAPVSVPVGKQTLGRVLNVIGSPVDGMGQLSCRCSRPASRSSTCSNPTSAAARSASSAVRASAKPSSSWS